MHRNDFQRQCVQNTLLDVDALLDVGLIASNEVLELGVVDGVEIHQPAVDDPVGSAGARSTRS